MARRKKGGYLKNIIFLLALVVAYNFYVGAKELEVPYISQHPELKNGCEITSLAMVLNYYGMEASKTGLADMYLNKVNIEGGDPQQGFLGNPYAKGYYCYEQPIIDAGEKYLVDVGKISNFELLNETGMLPFKIKYYIDKDTPIIVWYTIDDQVLRKNGLKWTMPNGQVHEAFSNSHCLVVSGYSPFSVTVVDPDKGKRVINIIDFTKIFLNSSQRAVVVQRK